MKVHDHETVTDQYSTLGRTMAIPGILYLVADRVSIQNYWVFGLWSLPGIPQTREHSYYYYLKNMSSGMLSWKYQLKISSGTLYV